MDNKLLTGIIEGVIRGNKDVYNPLFIYGEDGAVADVLFAIVSDFKKSYPTKRIVWKSGDDFTHEMIKAIVEDRLESFRRACRCCDLLIFDHVEIIAGRESTMHEFYEMFDHVFINGGKLVTAGRVPPGKIEGLDDRIRAQLEGGIIQQVG